MQENPLPDGPSSPAKRQVVVAIVDDDPGVLKGLKRVLDAYDYAADVFNSGEAFLASDDAKDNDVACIVLDIHLGGMSGIEVRRRLATTRNSQVPVIFMTALDTDAVRREALDAGCVDYLRKPFSGHDLIASIQKALTLSDQR
jgi:FixJ family two-component response regulator